MKSVKLRVLAVSGILILVSLIGVFTATAGATEPDKTPPTLALTGTAIQAVKEGKSTGTYELHIVASDGSKSVPQSGVAKIEVGVDGYGQQSWEKYCPEGNCSLTENWTYSPGSYSSEGPRWITVKVTDHAGNATEDEVTIEGIEVVPREAAPTGSDTTPPTITLAGSAQKAVWQGAASGKYELRMFATDGSPALPQSGVAKIEVAVDGTTLQSWEKYCPIGSCRLMVSWPYQPGNFAGTHHYVTVTARDHAGNVRTKKIEWDPTPPVVSASGELRTAENQYINGKGTKSLVFSASDNHSGVRRLILEDEGHGVLVSQTPAACIFKPLKDEECPLQVSETVAVNTNQMPEGANHLVVKAEDFAGNVSSGEAWTVYVDRTPPGVASGLSALREPEEADVAVTWAEAADPALADGTPGSGASIYEYRYKVGAGSWSAPATSQSREFSIPMVANGTTITVELTATDLVGNRGNTVQLSATVVEANFTQEEPGSSTGKNLEEIGFSNAPEPEDPAWAGGQSKPQIVQGPVTPAAAFKENKCGSAASPCGTYNGKEAAAYVREWHKRHNEAYDFFENDCIDFVNQALFAGNMQFERTDGFDDPTPVTEDYVNHYHLGTGSWWSAAIHNFGPVEYHWTESWSLVVKDYNRILGSGLGHVLPRTANLKKGDIVFYRFPDESGQFHSDKPWTHAAMISNITSEGVWVGQHTDNYERLLGDIYVKLDREFGPEGIGWFIQFVRPTKTMYNLNE